MTEIDYLQLKNDDSFNVLVDSNVWLMDNHKWALYVWELHREKTKISPYALVHVDYHWDSCYDFFEDYEKECELIQADIGEIFNFIHKENWIRHDSFIVPAIKRGVVDEVHFFCKQEDLQEIGICNKTLENCHSKQTIHNDIISLSNISLSKPIIFDLCLDLFNNSTAWQTSDIWAESDVIAFLTKIKHIIQKANVVTVSLSFGFSGSVEDTRNLARLVMPLILEWRKKCSATL